MKLTTAVAIASIAGSNGAAGGQLLDRFGNPYNPLRDSLEQITGFPLSIVMPLKRPDATELSLSSLPVQKAVAKKTVLRNEPGGRIDFHRIRFQQHNALGDEIEIRGMCHSACTLVMSYVPANRICFSAQGYLSFHKASYADGSVAMEHTLDMVKSYPTGIQAWIREQGGAENMPHKTAWVLAAPELWKMGYRRCPD